MNLRLFVGSCVLILFFHNIRLLFSQNAYEDFKHSKQLEHAIPVVTQTTKHDTNLKINNTDKVPPSVLHNITSDSDISTSQYDNNHNPIIDIATNSDNSNGVIATKIVAFASFDYRFIAPLWYDRLTLLGYNSHVIVATDSQTYEHFQRKFPSYRIEPFFVPPPPSEIVSMKPIGRKRRAEIQMLFALRWNYILQQLQQKKHHILLTDVDNIFSLHYPLESLELSEYDVFHAYETKFPMHVYQKQGFVVCGGMGWFRGNSSHVVEFIQLVVDECGVYCDDQVILNKVVANQLDMKWNETWETSGPHAKLINSSSVTTTTTLNEDDRNMVDRLDGLPQIGKSGISQRTHHKVKIWDRDFAYRGPLYPVPPVLPCPPSSKNWVAMPIMQIQGRGQKYKAKRNSFRIWDENCGINRTSATS